MIKIFDSSEISVDEIISRSEDAPDVSGVVSAIIEDVKVNKDAALYKYSKQFDKADLSSLEVSREEVDAAFSMVDERFISIVREAAENITLFHQKQARQGFRIEEDGKILGQKIIPLARVGLYVPGGTASYPSSVLMDAIPAKIAGVKDIVMTTPPSSNGTINPFILVAANIAGVDKILKLGGAQAIAALSFGTESVLKVDKIVGPGNAFVAEAKRQVYGIVDIDMIAGPSDILVIADDTCDARVIAADMLSQAEHDVLATAVLVTDSRVLAEAVQQELEVQLPKLSRERIARQSIKSNGKIIVVSSIDEAVEASNRIAPEHLEVCVESPFDYLDKIKNAGSIFLGKNCPEVLGDYFAGPNHTLPTNGTARFSSPLSVDDFIKKSSFIYYSREKLAEVYDKVAYFAEKEGLTAHAKSATVRFEE